MARSFVLKGECFMASNTADRVWALIEETVKAQGVDLWDVRFVKEGASYYLRVFIDSENGIDIDNCVDVSHAIDPILDDADPISHSYCLEVSSPGLERELIRPEHFEKMLGNEVKVKLYRQINGAKEIRGTLLSFENGNLALNVNDEDVSLSKGDYSSVRLADFD